MASKVIPAEPTHTLSPKEVLTYLKLGCEITTGPWKADSRPIAGVCPACDHKNEGGESECVECGGRVPVPSAEQPSGAMNGRGIRLHYGIPGYTPGGWEVPCPEHVFKLLLNTELILEDSGNADTRETHYRGDFGLVRIPLREITIDPATEAAGEEKTMEGDAT